MTLFLASVRDAAEAEIALLAGADIIDLKDPAQGALGAVDLETTQARSCARSSGRVPVSATIGDLPDAAGSDPRRGASSAPLAASTTSSSGCFPAEIRKAASKRFAPSRARVRLILVLFADALPAFDAVAAAADMGAAGIMLDTADKDAGSLLAHLDASAIGRFVGARQGARLDGRSRRLAQSGRRAGAARPLAGPPWLSRRALPGAPQRIARSRRLRFHPRPDPADRAAGGNQAEAQG